MTGTNTLPIDGTMSIEEAVVTSSSEYRLEVGEYVFPADKSLKQGDKVNVVTRTIVTVKKAFNNGVQVMDLSPNEFQNNPGMVPFPESERIWISTKKPLTFEE